MTTMPSEPTSLEVLARRAIDGDGEALAALVGAIAPDVLLLARRMLGDPTDAEDATQDIVVKVITSLGTFRGDSALKTWVYRIASNHLVTMKRGRREIFSFEMMDEFIEAGLSAALPPPPGADAAVLTEEVMVGCTQGTLLALDRDQRIALTLVDLLDLSGDDAAAIVGVEAATFRKRLQRARASIAAFMERRCGLVRKENPCRCEKMIGFSVAQGLLDPERLVHRARAQRLEAGRPDIGSLLQELRDLDDKARAILRSHPTPSLSDERAGKLRTLLASGQYRMFEA
jgi:RNA polymerase sigma factor (sigma-70 family)